MIAIVDYGAGNLTSVRLAWERLGCPARVTGDRDAILQADRVVFPGVGAMGAAMQRLAEQRLAETLGAVVARGTPFLGICLGAQVLFERSEEDGGVAGLGWLPGTVKSFRRGLPGFKVPQIGWNSVHCTRAHPVLRGLPDGGEFYFVHGYFPAPAERRLVLAETAYAGETFAAVVGRDNLVATQFHPERSGRLGLQLLENFARWDGQAPC